MDPYVLDLIIYKGGTFSKTFVFSKEEVVDVPLAWPPGIITWAAKVKNSDYTADIVSFTVTVVETTKANSVNIKLTATATAALLVGRYKWEMKATRTLDGWVWPIFSGNVFIKAEAATV